MAGEEHMTEVHNINGADRTRNVWYTTDDYGTLVRFVETESGVRFWWDAIHETAVAKILGYTQWKSKYD
jgi:hypothetical protein